LLTILPNFWLTVFPYAIVTFCCLIFLSISKTFYNFLGQFTCDHEKRSNNGFQNWRQYWRVKTGRLRFVNDRTNRFLLDNGGWKIYCSSFTAGGYPGTARQPRKAATYAHCVWRADCWSHRMWPVFGRFNLQDTVVKTGYFFTPIFFTPKFLFFLHQNFCFFYTKIFAFFTPKFLGFFETKAENRLNKNILFRLIGNFFEKIIFFVAK